MTLSSVPSPETVQRAGRWGLGAGRLGHWAAFAHDLVLSGAVMAGALIWRYQFEPKPLPDEMVQRATLTFLVVCAVSFRMTGMDRAMWRFTTLNDILRIARTVLLANLLVLPVLFLTDRLEDFPRTGMFVEAPVLILALTLSRLALKALRQGDLGAAFHLEDRRAPPAVVVGAPDAAADYLRQARRRGDRLRVMGVITPDATVVGRTIHGASVLGGLDRLADALAVASALGRRGETRVILADPRPSRALLETVVAHAADAGVMVVRRRGPGAAVSQIEAADLLDRPPRRLDLARARGLISGKRVLITGAGGTIGGELTRQIHALDPAWITLVEASEFNLYSIDQTLREMSPVSIWTAELGDVRDAARMGQIFAQARPQVVVHAAALKHVPLMEANPAEAVLTNVGGAKLIAELARDTAEVMVFISTDKAVNPTNVMGATKRVAERVVRAALEGGRAKAAVVRFGNVLGSAGSVVPLFERQIAEGGPVTVTHKDMIRYFMTVQEAVSLVLQAAALPCAEDGGGGVFVLDMGEPVRIVDLARQLIRLHGLRPDQDVHIRFSGLRPGEKLFEEVFYAAEDVRPTLADGVLAAFDRGETWTDLDAGLGALLRAAAARDNAEVLTALKRLEPAFQPQA